MKFGELLSFKDEGWKESVVYERNMNESVDRLLDMTGFDGVEAAVFQHPLTREVVVSFADGDRMLLVERKHIGRKEYARISEWRKRNGNGTA